MKKIYVGKINNTHGIKGELKVDSSFKYVDEVFCIGNTVYVGEYELKIVGVRNHQKYKLVFFDGYNDINDVLKFKGSDVYFNRELLNSNYVLNEDIIGFSVIVGDKDIGILDDVITNPAHEILVVGKTMIPYVSEFVKNIDFLNKKIYINDIEGLL